MADNNKRLPLSVSNVFELPIPPQKKATDYLNAYNGWVYSSITSIAQEVASVNLHLFKRKMVGGKIEADEILEHEVLSLLSSVNEYMTRYDLLEATQIYLDLIGEAFWYKLRDVGGLPVELWPLRPDWIKIKTSRSKLIEGYTYRPPGTNEYVLEPKDIIHFKYFNPSAIFRGKGTVQATAMEIDIDNFASEWNRSFFYNYAVPSAIITTERKIGQAEIERFLSDWHNKFQGRGRAHRLAFLSGGVDIKEISQKFKDMEFTEQKKLMRDQILATFKVPKTVLGMVDDVNRANAQATTRSFMERVITPRMVKLVNHLNEFLLNDYQDEGLFFDFDDPSPEDTEMNLSIYESGLKYGWLTPNEVREKENLPPVQGGDSIYISFTMQEMGKEKDKPDLTPFDNNPDEEDEDKKGLLGLGSLFNKKKKEVQNKVIKLDVIDKKKRERKFMIPIPHKRLRELRKEAIVKNLKPDLVKLVSQAILLSQGNKEKKKNKSFSNEQKEIIWRKFIARTDVWEDKMIEMLQNSFADQEREVTNNVNNIKYYTFSRRKGKESSLLFDLDQQNMIFKKQYKPWIVNVFTSQGREVLDFLGSGGELNTLTDSAIEYLEEEGLKFITDINSTTRNLLKDSLKEGLNKGEGIEDLKRRVQKVFADASSYRARLISRTEILKSTNAATNEAYKQSGVVQSKEWLTAFDERTCPECEDMDGEVAQLGENFKGAGVYPPLHPQCRCTTIPVIK